MILPIIKYGSTVLRKKALDIDKSENIFELTKNMTLTLIKAGGIGLAGPQVGVLKNIFVINTKPLKENDIEPVEKIFYNPVIMQSGNENVYYIEGCLSIPGINEEVLRPDKIEVRYRNENFDLRTEVFDGIIARIFQHEFDHLQGILFVDKLNPLRKKLIKSKLLEITRSQNH